MTRRFLVFIAAVLALGAQATRAQSDAAQIEKLFATAQHKATVDGDLRGAIDTYQRVIAKAGTNRALAAQALVRMAECYQKLGDSQFRSILEQVIREYADQPAIVAEARTHLKSREVGAVAMSVVHRKVWSGQEALNSLEGSVSPDGRYISYPDWETGNLALHDLVTGTNRRLTSGGYVEPHQAYAQNSAISRDGKQIVYTWFNGKNSHELRAVSLQSTGIQEPRRLFASEETDYIVPFDWTPDGKWIAVQNQRKDRSSQIGLVSTADGSLRVLKSVGWRGASRLALSPDGRFLGFDLPASDDTNGEEHDVFVLAVDASRETAVVAAAGDDRIVGWSPDGAWLLFTSDRTGASALWAAPMEGGRAQGPSVPVKPNMAGWPIGVTTSGALFTVDSLRLSEVKVASLDLATGRVLSAPSGLAHSRAPGIAPEWSPDGTQLAFVSFRGQNLMNRTLAIVSPETGMARELPVALRYFGAPRWAPDSRSLAVSGQDLQGGAGVYRIDSQTGSTTQLVVTPNAGNVIPQWSPDGSKIYYFEGGVIRGTAGSVFVERDLASGRVREVYRGVGPGFPNISPDGRLLAGVVDDDTSSTLTLIPVFGGERKELLRVHAPQNLRGFVTWTPDGQGVITWRLGPAGRDLILVPIDGGPPRTLDVNTRGAGDVRVHPDGRQVAFMESQENHPGEVWVLENFLPSLSAKR